jgi:hypothetical protein
LSIWRFPVSYNLSSHALSIIQLRRIFLKFLCKSLSTIVFLFPTSTLLKWCYMNWLFSSPETFTLFLTSHCSKSRDSYFVVCYVRKWTENSSQIHVIASLHNTRHFKYSDHLNCFTAHVVWFCSGRMGQMKLNAD